MRKQRDHYKILGVLPTSTTDEIRDRFRFLCQAFHPDKFPNRVFQRLAEEEFKVINAAHRVLSDPRKRPVFDNPAHGPHSHVGDGVSEDVSQIPPAEKTVESTEQDHYAVLNLLPGATTREVEKRCHFLAAAFQEDRFASLEHKQRANEDLLAIEQAWRVLSDPVARNIYDNTRPRSRLVPRLKPQFLDSGYVLRKANYAEHVRETDNCRHTRLTLPPFCSQQRLQSGSLQSMNNSHYYRGC